MAWGKKVLSFLQFVGLLALWVFLIASFFAIVLGLTVLRYGGGSGVLTVIELALIAFGFAETTRRIIRRYRTLGGDGSSRSPMAGNGRSASAPFWRSKILERMVSPFIAQVVVFAILRRRSFSGIVGRAVTRRHALVLTGLGSLIVGCWLLDGPSWFLVFNALMAGWYAIDILVVQYRVAAGVYGETAPEVLAAANFVVRERRGRSGGGGHFDKVFETAADTASDRSAVHAPGGAVAR